MSWVLGLVRVSRHASEAESVFLGPMSEFFGRSDIYLFSCKLRIDGANGSRPLHHL